MTAKQPFDAEDLAGLCLHIRNTAENLVSQLLGSSIEGGGVPHNLEEAWHIADARFRELAAGLRVLARDGAMEDQRILLGLTGAELEFRAAPIQQPNNLVGALQAGVSLLQSLSHVDPVGPNAISLSGFCASLLPLAVAGPLSAASQSEHL
jgi:hypothetical protein